MNEGLCPWCEAPVDIAPETVTEQQCPECLTTWTYDDASVDAALPLAA